MPLTRSTLAELKQLIERVIRAYQHNLKLLVEVYIEQADHLPLEIPAPLPLEKMNPYMLGLAKGDYDHLISPGSDLATLCIQLRGLKDEFNDTLHGAMKRFWANHQSNYLSDLVQGCNLGQDGRILCHCENCSYEQCQPLPKGVDPKRCLLSEMANETAKLFGLSLISLPHDEIVLRDHQETYKNASALRIAKKYRTSCFPDYSHEIILINSQGRLDWYHVGYGMGLMGCLYPYDPKLRRLDLLFKRFEKKHENIYCRLEAIAQTLQRD